MKKTIFIVTFVVLTLVMALCVGATGYEPDFGEVTILDGVSEPTIIDTTSRVLMTDGKTYPAYYILNDSTSFSPNFAKINNVVGANTYSRETVLALELPEGITNLPSCWSAGAFFQGDKYEEVIEYLKMPSTLETMGDAAIFQITTLKVIDNFENTKVVDIPTRLDGLTALQFIHLPNTVKTIPARAFFNCTSVEYIILGANIEFISTQAFYRAGANSQTDTLKVYISKSITEIKNEYGEGILQGCKSIVELYYTGNMEDSGMAQILANPGIHKNATKWQTVDASADIFEINGTYTTSTIIYNYNVCEAFNGGKHSISEVSTCLVKCSNCNTTYEKENPVHEEKAELVKSELGYFDNIKANTKCENCGKILKTEDIPALFNSLGYSSSGINGVFAITQGFKINKNAVIQYKEYVPSFTFGVLATGNALKQESYPVPNDAKVWSYELSSLKHDFFEIKVTGISDEQKDSYIILCAYITEGEKLYYLDNGLTLNSVVGVSYNNASNFDK